MSLDDIIKDDKKKDNSSRGGRANKGRGKGRRNGDAPEIKKHTKRENTRNIDKMNMSLDDIAAEDRQKKNSRRSDNDKRSRPSRNDRQFDQNKRSRGFGRFDDSMMDIDDDMSGFGGKGRFKGQGKGKGKGRGKGKGSQIWSNNNGKGKGKGKGSKGGSEGRIKLSNLDFSIMAEDIEEFFQDLGGLVQVWVDYDSTDRSMGTGGAVFTTHRQAEAALRFRGIMIEGHALHIEVNSSSYPSQGKSQVINVLASDE